MPWTSSTKSIDITKTAPHHISRPGVTGRAPGVGTVTFRPAELFGAAARCSHMHFINPLPVTPESRMVKALVEHYVDDTSNDFFLLNGADRFKDFVANHFFGPSPRASRI